MIMNINPISKELQLRVENLKNKMTPDSYKYIGVDEGWYLIVADCDTDLTAINPDYQILQIKEKFGTLRYYYKTNSKYRAVVEAMARYVDEAEIESMYTCEECGERGLLRREIGYRKTLCESCYASR